MSKPLLAGVMLCALSISQVADAQRRAAIHKVPGATATPPPKVEPAACAGLMSDYDRISKQMASRQADDALDSSAVRATMRETQNTAGLTRASMTLDLMKSNGCKLPSYAPSASRYGSAALSCTRARQEVRTKRALDRLANRFVIYDDPAECDSSKWQPETE